MKKITIMFLLFAAFYAGLQAIDISDKGGTNGYGWALIASDIGFTGATIWAVMDERNMADSYATLKSSIDNTTEANYYQLLYQKAKVDSQGNTALYLGITAGVSLVYTAVDFFWLHNAFSNPRVGVEVNYNPFQKEYELMVMKEF
jgi:hypothetical protein